MVDDCLEIIEKMGAAARELEALSEELNALRNDEDYFTWIKFFRKYYRKEGNLYRRPINKEKPIDESCYKAHFEGMFARAKGIGQYEIDQRWDALNDRVLKIENLQKQIIKKNASFREMYTYFNLIREKMSKGL